MTLLDFMHEHMVFTWACAIFWSVPGVIFIFLALYLGAQLTEVVIRLSHNLIFRISNRFFRVLKVWVRGWPPPHLDADGDWKPEKKERTE